MKRLSQLPGGAVVEGPVPAVVADWLGIRDEGAAEATGAFQVVDEELRSAGVAHGAMPGGAFGMGTSRPVELRPERQWPATLVGLTEPQAGAWRARGWDARRWSLAAGDTRVLADWIGAGLAHDRSPGIVQRAGLVGCCAGLFAFLGQSHTVAPYEGGEHRNWPRVDSAETLLLGMIDLLHDRAGAQSLSLAPWPEGRSWSMHVRHDVDRPPAAAGAAAIAARHQTRGTHATWYWRARHLGVRDGQVLARHDGNAALKAVASTPGHEIALHTEALWQGSDNERETVEAVLGRRVWGSSAHGDPTCFRFQGAPNLMWAEEQRLAYTELISNAHSRPHRAALLTPAGEVTLTTTVCLPHHASFDRSMTSGDVLADEVRAEAARMQRAGGLLQILNHPDINVEALSDLLASLPSDGRWDATAVEAIEWWSTTHPAGAVTLEMRGDGTVVVSAGSSPLTGLQVEVRDPGGSMAVRSVTLPAGGRTVMS